MTSAEGLGSGMLDVPMRSGMVRSDLSLRLLCQQWSGMVLGFCCGTEQKGGGVSNRVCTQSKPTQLPRSRWGGGERLVQISPLENII